MNNSNKDIATDPTSARALLDRFGGFDDCYVERLTQDFQKSAVVIAVDDLGRGTDALKGAGGQLLFEAVEYSSVRIPFVGGRVRIESCDVGSRRGKIELKLGLTTTEWLDSAEFSVVEVVVVCGSIEVRQDVTG